jgi:hypothetical protein
MFSLLLIGLVSKVWYILQVLALASHWLERFSDGTPISGKLTNKTPLTVSETPAARQQLL